MMSPLKSISVEEESEDPICLVDLEDPAQAELPSSSAMPADNRQKTHESTMLLEECLHMVVKVVRCDQHLWYHRKSLPLLDPKISLAMKKYLEETETNKGFNAECGLGHSNVFIVGGSRLPSDVKNTVADPPDHPILSALLNKNVRPDSVGNFIVSDNSVLKKRPCDAGNTQTPLKIKIKEILTIKDMSPKRRSQINFRKNKGLVGLKILRKNVNTKLTTESVLAQGKQVNGNVLHKKPGPKCFQRKQSKKEVAKIANDGHNGKKLAHCLVKHGNSQNTPNDSSKNDFVEKQKDQNTKIQPNDKSVKTIVSYSTIAPRPMLSNNNPNQEYSYTILKENTTDLAQQTISNGKPTTGTSNTILSEAINKKHIQQRNEMPRILPDVAITNETSQLITEIKTEHIKQEILDNDKEISAVLPPPQGVLINSIQAAPAKSTELNVTRVYASNNPNVASCVDVSLRPTLYKEQPNRPSLNHYQPPCNNTMLPTPFPTFQHPQPVIHSGEMRQNYGLAQPNWQQQQYMNTQHQLQSQNQGGNMQWNNYQNGVNLNVPQYSQTQVANVQPQYNMNQMTPQIAPVSNNDGIIHSTFNANQNQISAPHSTQVITNSNFAPHLSPTLSTQSSTNMPAPTHGALANDCNAPLISRGVITHTHMKPPPPYPESHINVVLPTVSSDASHFQGNIYPACSQKNLSTNAPIISQCNDNRNNVPIHAHIDPATFFRRKKPLVHHPNQSVSLKTLTTWANSANPQTSNTLTHPADYQCFNQVHGTQIDQYGNTNLNFAWHHPTQPPSIENHMNSVNTTLKNTGDLKKVSLVAIKKQASGRNNPNFLKIGNTTKGRHHSNTEKDLSTDAVNMGTPKNLKTIYMNSNGKKKTTNKPATNGNRGGSAISVKIRSGSSALQNYSPPILPIRSVHQILLNSKSALVPATVQVMKRPCINTWSSNQTEVLDPAVEKSKFYNKEVKKISLEEYKKRAAKTDTNVIDLTEDDKKTLHTNNQKSKQFGVIKNVEDYKGRKSVDSQDLGYDSDVQRNI